MLLLFIVVLPMHYTANFKAVKIDNVQMEVCDLLFAQNIHSGYTLNLPKGGCSNEYQNPCLKKENICRSLPRYLLTYLQNKGADQLHGICAADKGLCLC